MIKKLIKSTSISTWLSLTLIITLFSILYFPQTLIMNENVETIAAFEIDASTAIESVFQHLETYNLQKSYNSQFYGWTYYFINYISLKPLLFINDLLNINYSPSLTIFLIKTIFFIISLLSSVTFFILIKKLFDKNLIAFVSTILYIIAPLKTTFFTYIKPETTGLLFLFLSYIFLIDFIKKKNGYTYIYSIIFISLSILSKQNFTFLVFPLLISFLFYYIETNKIKNLRHFFSKKFLFVFITSILIFISIFFIIFPHAFIHPKSFINTQILMLGDHNSNGALVLKGKDLYDAWEKAFFNNPFLKLTAIVYPLSLLLSFHKKNIKFRIFYSINLIFTPLIIFVFCKNAGLFISTHYLAPLTPLFFIILIIPLSTVLKLNNNIIKNLFVIIYLYLLLILFSNNFFNLNHELENRKKYKQSEIFEVTNYVLKEIDIKSKIAIGDSVLLPNKNYITCHWWQECNLNTTLHEFNPDYFIFIENVKYNNIYPEYYLNYTKYIKNNNFTVQTKIGKYVIYKKSKN